MRTADEIFRKIEIEKPPIFRSYIEAAVIGIKAIRVAQTEAWNEALEAAVRNADTYYYPGSEGFSPSCMVDENSILKLKK